MRRPRIIGALLSPYPDLDAIHGDESGGWPPRFHPFRRTPRSHR